MRKVTNKNGFGEDRVLFQTVNKGASMTVQSDAHLTDIKNILKRYGQEGMQMLDEAALEFGDVSEFGDFHDVMLEVKRAETEFMKLPAQVRSIFGNSVEQWLDTAHDEDKRDELVAAGFIKDKKNTIKTGTSGVGGGVETAPAAAPEAEGSAGAE